MAIYLFEICTEDIPLTHCGRVTHIWSVNLSSLVHITDCRLVGAKPLWTNDAKLSIWPLGTNFNEISIELHIFSFKKMHLKILSSTCQPFCLCLNVPRSISELCLAFPGLICMDQCTHPPRDRWHSWCSIIEALACRLTLCILKQMICNFINIGTDFFDSNTLEFNCLFMVSTVVLMTRCFDDEWTGGKKEVGAGWMGFYLQRFL